jgi:hypothetical protein
VGQEIGYLLQGLKDTIHVGDLAVVGIKQDFDDIDTINSVDLHSTSGSGRRSKWQWGKACEGRRCSKEALVDILVGALWTT